MAQNSAATVEMEKELYVAAMNGNVEFLQEPVCNNEYLLRKTCQKNNIIHIAVRHEQHEFIDACIRKLPDNYYELLCQTNSKESTPFHVAGEVGNLSVVRLLYSFIEEWVRIAGHEGDEKPWRKQNLKGNTPVHVALIHDNVKIARFLLEKDPSLAHIVNESKEAPLHLAIKHHVNYSESESIITKIRQPINEGGAALESKFVIGEDMSSMINFLIEKGSCVACLPDANGYTPLHRAASLSMPYNIQVVKSILYHCPQSAEVFDSSGKSILHLLIGKIPDSQEGKKLLQFKAFYALRNHQDHQGNTPLHIATESMDVIMVRVLLQSSTKLSIKNVDCVSVASLIQRHNLLEMLRKRKLTEEESEALDKLNINFLRERTSRIGIMNFLLTQDNMARNVLHRLMHMKTESHIMKDDFVDFVQQILEKFPTLVCQTDVNGDTPIHVLVRSPPETVIYDASGAGSPRKRLDFSGLLSVLLELCNACILKIKEEARLKEARYDSPWLVQNAQGNTPLHEAVVANNNKLMKNLLKHDQRAATLINKNKETPLHLLARHPIPQEREVTQREDIVEMVNASVEAAHSPDQDGLTPLLRALQVGNLYTAYTLCDVIPVEAAIICDANEQTFWHLLVCHPSEYYFIRLLRIEKLRGSLKLKDKDGNTSLHLAIERKRYDLVQVFLDVWASERESSPRSKNQWLVQLLEDPNKAGKTPGQLIAETLSLPPKIEKSFGDKYEMIGVRSMWGIPTTQMKTYVNTMGIIAALLTTITFTAAFTIPGGLIQDSGTPVLIKKTAFQVFMVADIVAMCLSMMVLFCLLWMMATNKRHNSVIILDFSVTLLLSSFYATIVTFMTGLFATMYTVRPWIAIMTLVLCSLLMLLVHKFLVIKLLIPFRKAVWMFLRFAHKSCTKSAGWCKAKGCCGVGGLCTKVRQCCQVKPSKGAVGQVGLTRQLSVVVD